MARGGPFPEGPWATPHGVRELRRVRLGRAPGSHRRRGRARPQAGHLGGPGSSHRLSGAKKPHNSLDALHDGGQVVERYYKRFCSGAADGTLGDLAHDGPGDHFNVWDIDGVRWAAHSSRLQIPRAVPRVLKFRVERVFDSFHAAHASAERIAAIALAIGQSTSG